MSDNSVSRREFERKRLIAQDHMAMEKLRKREEAEAKKKEEELYVLLFFFFFFL